VVAARTRDLGWAERAALASVAFAVFFVLGELPQTLIPVIGADELGLSVSLVGAGLAVAGLSRLIGAVIAGMVSDRVSRKAALIPSMIAMGASVAVLAFPPTRASWLVALALLSLASSGVSVAATIIGDRVPREIVGRRMGSFRVAGDFGLLVGPAAGGLLYQHAGRPAAVLLGAAVLVASGLACAVVVAEPRTVA
jgi:MFS family permease